jgi:alpha-galactosidase
MSRTTNLMAGLVAGLLIAAGIAVFLSSRLSNPPHSSNLGSELARTPPMGFDDWNAFHCHVSAQLIEQTAAAIVSSGLKAAGYEYVNIDDCWQASSRDANGKLRASPKKFPEGIKVVAAYVHSLGLKLGIYEAAGTKTCAGYPGSYGHESQDAATFASWGVDYLKYDWCNVPYAQFPGSTHQEVAQLLYGRMHAALLAPGRPIVFSMSNPADPTLHPWAWAQSIANLWRTTGDIADSWSSVLTNMDQNELLVPYAGPGHWNDPDMLEVGNGGMTTAEAQAHFSLWSIMAAPLIASTDIRTMSSETRRILTNREVIAVDQDPLGLQGTVVVWSHDREVLMKPLANGDRAVVLLNRGGQGTQINVSAGDLGLRKTPRYAVRDLWTHAGLFFTNTVSAFVAPHSVVMLRIHLNAIRPEL